MSATKILLEVNRPASALFNDCLTGEQLDLLLEIQIEHEKYETPKYHQ